MSSEEMNAAIEQMRTTKAEFAGKRVRVTRVLIYEGTYEEMLSQIGQSKPTGLQNLGRLGKTLEIFEQPWEVVNLNEEK